MSSSTVSRPSGLRFPQFPYLMSRLMYVAAMILIFRTLFPGTLWIATLTDIFSTFVFTVDTGGIGAAVFFVILGVALMRQKRVGWWVAIVYLGFNLLGSLLITVTLVSAVVNGQWWGIGDQAYLARFALNLGLLSGLVALLVAYRGEFAARRTRGNVRKAILTLVAGLIITVGISMLLVSVFPGELERPRGRFIWIFHRIIGDRTYGQLGAAPPNWIGAVVGLLTAATLLSALFVLMRAQRQAAYLSPEEEGRVRALLPSSTEDSLAYFGTRRDKSVVFAGDGSAAITYRVELGVCLASSDPLGPQDHWPGAIKAWQGLIRQYGWTPAVIGASEAGATAYAASGLRVIRLGDEAILEPATFRLDGRDMRPVRQAVQRLERMGYQTTIRRHSDIPGDEMAELIRRADDWRDTETERGFSMALGRLGDASDGDCLMVEARFPVDRPRPGGPLAGFLSFVPWGTDGCSLDVMRRHPAADNGITELMVCALLAGAHPLGIRRVSLNFAVFRSAFEEGARIGAGPVQRLWRRLLLVASRWWQIESLYRSNVKYRPFWSPRFLCFADTGDIALVGAASGVAEGFIDLPGFLRARPVKLTAAQQPWMLAPTATAPPAGSPEVDRAAEPIRPAEQTRLRMQMRKALLAQGTDPYPPDFTPTHRCVDLELGQQVRVAGRVLAVRDHGGVIFVKIRDWSGDAQLMLTRSTTGDAAMGRLRTVLDLGDHCGAWGTMVLSRRGELSVEVDDWRLTAKSLRPLPDKYKGMADPEARVRQRYLDLAVNPSSRTQLAARSAIIRAVRDGLDDHGYLEVETPILQTIHGGANARPFRTHINAYNLPLYLRIAPELFLKRLMVGGVDKVFEIGRNFRNEGADATHNPEFTMLEAYQAYGDYMVMRGIAEDLVKKAALVSTGGSMVRGTDHHGQWHQVDLAEPWPVITVNAAISAAAGVQVTADTDRDQLVRLSARLGVPCDERWSRGNVLLELYEHLVEDQTIRPTFYTDFPAEVSPLTRAHRVDPRLAERWDLVAFGAEIGTAYSELVDPVEQRNRLTAQSLQATGGDPEAMELDEDFLTALEYAMPPSGGLGMGMDRLVMMLTHTSIRETVTFPLVRPRSR